MLAHDLWRCTEARIISVALLLGAVSLTSSCDADTPVEPENPPEPPPALPVAAAVEILSPDDTLRALGRQVSLTLDVRDADGASLSDFEATWTSSAPHVVPVDDQGTATAEAPGVATIRAAVDGVEDSVTLTVIQVPASVSVEPSLDSLWAIGDSLLLTGQVRDSTGHVVPGVTLSWATSDPLVATVSNGGMVTAVGVGDVRVSAVAGSREGAAEVVVRQRPASLSLTPHEVTLAVGASVGLTLAVTDAGGAAVADPAVSWSSADLAVATVTEGVVRAVGEGATWVRAGLGPLADSTRVRVEKVEVPPEPFLVVEPDSLHFDAWGVTFELTTYLDDGTGSRTEVDADWAIRDLEVVVWGGGHRFITRSDGATWVVFQYQGSTDSARVSIERVITDWVVEPEAVSLGIGGTADVRAYTLDRAGTEVYTRTDWSVRDPAVASLDTHAFGARVLALATGETWVRAAALGFVDSLRVSVSDVLIGSVTVRSEDDLARLEGISRVVGNVEIVGSTLTRLPGLEALTRIDGDLVIRGNEALTEIEDLALKEVGGSLRIDHNPVLARAGLPALARVGGWMVLEGNPRWVVPRFPSLGYLGAGLIHGNGGLVDGAVFEQLVEVATSFEIRQGPVLQLSSLERVGGALALREPGPLGLEVPRLSHLPSLRVSGMAEMATLRLPSLGSVGELVVGDNVALTSIELPALSESRAVAIVDNPLLRSVRLPKLTEISLNALRNPALEELALDGLQRVEHFSVDGGRLRTLRVPETTGPRAEIFIQRMAELETLTLEATEAWNVFVVGVPALTSLALPHALDLGELRISSAAKLTRVEAPNLVELRALRLQVTAVDGLSLPLLHTVRETIVLGWSPYLRVESIDLPRLRSAKALAVVSMKGLTDLSPFAGLTSSLWWLQVAENPSLTSIDALASLGDAEGVDPIVRDVVQVVENPSLPTSEVEAFLEALDAKFDGSAFPGQVDVRDNGPG